LIPGIINESLRKLRGLVTLWEVLLEQHTVLNKKNGIFTKILTWSVASLCPQSIYGS
jgi:hypothetical protein